MPQPQPGIIAEPGEHARFAILRAADGAAARRQIARALARIPAVADKVGALDRRAKLFANVGVGPELFARLSPQRQPRGLRPFVALRAGGRSAPNTGGDILFHIVARRADLTFEMLHRLMADLGDTVQVSDDVTGFRYLDSRDLTGFIDGTENPKGKARATAALIGAEDPVFRGSSFVFTQRYVHDLRRWSALSQREQEAAIGRRRRDSAELSARSKPATAHISRVVIEENGEELQIVRHSFPYGTAREAGLFFIAYTKDLAIPEKMLRRSMGKAGDGLHDRLMDFTRAVSGATFFAPSLQVLRSLGR